MSDSGTESITATADGVTVTKSLNDEDFQTLAVVLELSCEREEPATVVLTDDIPDSVPMDDVGFHPQYGADHWSTGDGTVSFERRFDPGETFTTIYGVREYDEETAAALSTEPHLEISAEALEDPIAAVDAGPGFEEIAEDLDELENIVSMEQSDAVREFVAGERDGLGPTAEAEAEGDDVIVDASLDVEVEEGAEPADEMAEAEPVEASDAEPVEASDAEPVEASDAEPIEAAEAEPIEAAGVEPVEPEPEAGESTVEDEPVVEPPEPEPPSEPEIPPTAEARDDRELTVPVTGGVTRVLIKEIRSGSVADEDLEALREALGGVAPAPTDESALPGSVDARLNKLQSSVAELEAYTDALEGFLDTEGTPYQIVDDVREEIREVEDDLRSVDDRLGDVDDSVGSVRQELSEVRSEMQSLQAMVSTVEEDAEQLGARTQGNAERLDELQTAQAGVDDDVSAMKRRVDSLESELASLDEVQSATSELSSEIEAINDELTQLQAFRERLSKVFAAQTAAQQEPEEGDNGE